MSLTDIGSVFLINKSIDRVADVSIAVRGAMLDAAAWVGEVHGIGTPRPWVAKKESWDDFVHSRWDIDLPAFNGPAMYCDRINGVADECYIICNKKSVKVYFVEQGIIVGVISDYINGGCSAHFQVDAGNGSVMIVSFDGSNIVGQDDKIVAQRGPRSFMSGRGAWRAGPPIRKSDLVCKTGARCMSVVKEIQCALSR